MLRFTNNTSFAALAVVVFFLLVNVVDTKAQCAFNLNVIGNNTANYCNVTSPQKISFLANIAGETGTGPYTYNWTCTGTASLPSPTSGSGITSTLPATVFIDFIAGGAATFCVTVTDANRCSSSNCYSWNMVQCAPKIRIDSAALNFCPCEISRVKFSCAEVIAPNIFYVQLSDTNGSFSTISVDTIESLMSNLTGSGYIPITIPCNISPGGKYRIRIIASDDGFPLTSNDNGANISIGSGVIDSVIITANPPGSICSGSGVTYTAQVYTAFNPNYQWYVNGNAVGTNSNTYTSGSLQSGDIVKCQATASSSCDSGTAADSVTVSALQPVVDSVFITTDPTGVICQGTPVTFRAHPYNGGSSPAYHWYINNVLTGNSIDTLTVNNLPVGSNVIKCQMISSLSCTTTPDAFDNVTVIVSARPGISITENPNGLICSNATVNFTANNTNAGSDVSYQWVLNGQNVGSNANVYSTDTLTNGDTVSCILSCSGVCNGLFVVESNKIIVSIIAPLLSDTVIGNSFIFSGSTNTYSTDVIVGATSYTWTVPTDWVIINGQGTTTITVKAGSSGGAVTVKANDTICSNPTANENVTVQPLPTGIQKTGGANDIFIYPNPSDGNVTISTNGTETIKEIIITNTLGQVLSDIITSTGNNKTMQVQLPTASGLYFIRMRGGQGEYVSKVVRE